VQVFKLITLNTFEERIDELIRKKSKLMNEIITADDQTLIKTLTREELLELLGG
jgi:SNF2 family DNA or RNA helicase